MLINQINGWLNQINSLLFNVVLKLNQSRVLFVAHHTCERGSITASPITSFKPPFFDLEQLGNISVTEVATLGN